MNNPSNEKHQDTPPLELSDECARIREHMSFIEALVTNMVAEKEKEERRGSGKTQRGNPPRGRIRGVTGAYYRRARG